MSDAQPTTPPPAAAPAAPSVSWRRRAVRRTAGSLGAAVVLAAVGPAVANAAGADVANPVAIALRASGETLKDAFAGADEEATAAPCVTPSADPTEVVTEPSAEPTEAVTDPTAEPTEVVTDPSAEPTEAVTDPSAEPTEAVTDPSAEPTEAVTDPTADPAETGTCAEAEATASPTESPEEPAEEEDGEHGQVVSTVARCAPKGKDRLLEVEGAPANHGGYVKVAAHGDTLTLPWGTYDLSTQAGADELCASLDAARAALPEEPAAEKTRGKKDKGDHGRPDKAAKPAKAEQAKPAKADRGKGGSRQR